MTRDAQSALRRTMEKEGKSTRFCLVCNYISRIIEPITSRCAKFRFKSLSAEAITKRIQLIAGAENVALKEADTMDALIETSEGDMRKAITTLQSCARLNSEITTKQVYEVGNIATSQLPLHCNRPQTNHLTSRQVAWCLKNGSMISLERFALLAPLKN